MRDRAERFMDSFPYIDILFFAAVAAFLVFRLRNVLGKKIGNENPEHARRDRAMRKDERDRAETDRPDADDKIVQLPDLTSKPDLGAEEAAAAAEIRGEPGSVAAGLQKIQRADPSFTPDGFLGGARAAFESIVQAFAAGDLRSLKPLLSETVFDQFRQVVKTRETAGQTLETTLVGIDKADIIEADMRDRTAVVTVSFRSEQVNVIRDKDGNAVEGDATHVDRITDIWTFARNTRSRDPNWTLIATRSPN
ncbi:MAG: Tim44/TimA family putative adaptor protein [Rhodospirillaceae bacterium]|nr:Tim44/TimA family putative adaptor protein [Rhodospirillaceae bacterium]